MIPEFYFRGASGAYSLEEYQTVVSKLRGIVNKPQYKDWLFVFGSILANYDQLATESQGSLADNPGLNPDYAQSKASLVGKVGHMGGRKTALNVVFIQKGNGGEDESLVVLKEVMSHIDFMGNTPDFSPVRDQSGQVSQVLYASPQGGLRMSDVDHARAGKSSGITAWDRNQAPGKESQDEDWKRYAGLGIFTTGGITFGVEVCLDHALKRLRKSPPKSGENWVQIQLIPSAGMSIEDDAVIACTDGYVFNCDGGTPHSKVVKVKSDWTGGAGVTEEIAAQYSVTKVHSGSPHESYYQGDANIRIYPSKLVPSARKVA